MVSKLSFKQRLFIEKYIQNNGNRTQAVLNTYNVKNTNSAAVIGCRLLRNVKVQRKIRRILEAEESIPSRVSKLIDNVINNGTGRDQLKVIQVVLKLYGVL